MNFNINYRIKHRLPVLLHLMAWGIILVIPRYLVYIYGGDQDRHFLTQIYANTAIYGVLFYLNYLWLIPRFFFRENKLMYFTLVIVVIILLYWVMVFINDHLLFDPERERQMTRILDLLRKENENARPPLRQFHVYNFIYTAILISGFSLGLALVERYAGNEKKRKELEKEKLNSELAFLKNQISPHFFFNTLNNIYSLIEINTKEAQRAIHQLSKMMRYLLYDSEHGQTLLMDEIGFMNHYIDLMKLRLSPRMDLQVRLPDNAEDLRIPPLLFIAFLENAFKHGVSYREKAFIEIRMEIRDSTIFFSCRNRILQPVSSELSHPDTHSGIGLENVKKRLALLFPGRHRLDISTNDHIFEVKLELFLN